MAIPIPATISMAPRMTTEPRTPLRRLLIQKIRGVAAAHIHDSMKATASVRSASSETEAARVENSTGRREQCEERPEREDQPQFLCLPAFRWPLAPGY